MIKFSEFITEAKWPEPFKLTTAEVAKAYAKNKYGYDFTEENDEQEIIGTLDMIASDIREKFRSKIDAGAIGLIKHKGSNMPGGISYRGDKDISKEILKWVSSGYNPN